MPPPAPRGVRARRPSRRTLPATTNATAAVFDITGTYTIKGLFIAGGNSSCQTKGDNTSGSGRILWSAAAFAAGNVSVLSGDQLKITYTVTA